MDRTIPIITPETPLANQVRIRCRDKGEAVEAKAIDIEANLLTLADGRVEELTGYVVDFPRDLLSHLLFETRKNLARKAD